MKLLRKVARAADVRPPIIFEGKTYYSTGKKKQSAFGTILVHYLTKPKDGAKPLWLWALENGKVVGAERD